MTYIFPLVCCKCFLKAETNDMNLSLYGKDSKGIGTCDTCQTQEHYGRATSREKYLFYLLYKR